MRLVKQSLFIVLLLEATTSFAHPPSSLPPWEAWEDWRLVGFDQNESAVVLLGTALTQRAGSAANIELLTISRAPDPEWKTDQVNEHYLLDCSSLVYRMTEYQPFLPKGAFPPPLVRDLGEQPAPPSGSLLRAAFEMACGSAPLPVEKIEKPYKWARAQFQLRKSK